MPPHHTKSKQDLPSEVTKRIAEELKLQIITDNFKYYGNKPELKDLSLDKKWPNPESSDLRYEGDKLDNEKVILIDDLYQPGTTMQFMAMKLQEAGACHVYGLSMVKNLNDKDNK